jgi:hypothetical protein
MKILYGKCFGLGNCVMAIPAIKALTSLFCANGDSVDILIGSTPDDGGAFDVLSKLSNKIYLDNVPLSEDYDIAIMAIPFDGRWKNGIHFNAKRVMDTRPRPDFCPTLGMSSWKKHEAEYQMDNAIELGFTGLQPDSSFLGDSSERDPDLVYLGLGFKRDKDTFWSQKHWGNERFVTFIQTIRILRPNTRFISTGNIADVIQAGAPIMSRIADPKIFLCKNFNLNQSFDIVKKCGSYFGNDTGMMHVAASAGLPVYTMMAFEGSEIKNPPLCTHYKCNNFSSGTSDPIDIAKDFVNFIWGQ